MAGEPDSKDIRITVDFLKTFQQRVVQRMLDEFAKDLGVTELSYIEKLAGGQRALKAGVEKWLPAKVLMDSYDGPTGTGRTLYNEVKAMKTALEELNRQITGVIDLAVRGEDEALRLTTELNSQQVGAIFGAGSPAPSPAPGTGG